MQKQEVIQCMKPNTTVIIHSIIFLYTHTHTHTHTYITAAVINISIINIKFWAKYAS